MCVLCNELFQDKLASAEPDHSQYLIDFYNGILSCLIEVTLVLNSGLLSIILVDISY